LDNELEVNPEIASAAENYYHASEALLAATRLVADDSIKRDMVKPIVEEMFLKMIDRDEAYKLLLKSEQPLSRGVSIMELNGIADEMWAISFAIREKLGLLA